MNRVTELQSSSYEDNSIDCRPTYLESLTAKLHISSTITEKETGIKGVYTTHETKINLYGTAPAIGELE